jgi:hypothetical protein
VRRALCSGPPSPRRRNRRAAHKESRRECARCKVQVVVLCSAGTIQSGRIAKGLGRAGRP